MGALEIYLRTLDAKHANPSLSDGMALLVGLSKGPYSVILIIYSLLFSIFVIPLSIYHHKIISKGRTTNEDLKGTFKYSNQPNSFNKGYFKNLMDLVWVRQRAIKWEPQDEIPAYSQFAIDVNEKTTFLDKNNF